MFISILYMFRAAMSPSSGELIVSKRHLVSLCIDDRLVCRFGWDCFFMYVYFYSLHVSGSHVPIIRRINCIKTASGICHSVQMTVWCAGLDEAAFSCMFISILYMFRAAMCPSSGELIVSKRHLVYVTLCRWPFGVQVWMRLLFHVCLFLFSTCFGQPCAHHQEN